MSAQHTVTVLGDGAWGTASAHLLASCGHKVILWCNNPDAAHAMRTTRCNTPYLPVAVLHESIEITTDLACALSQSTFIFEAIPVKFMRSVLMQAKPWITLEHVWVVLSKGIEKDTLRLPSQIIDDVLGYKANSVVMSGPSFAHDLVCKQPTAVVVASSHDALAREVADMVACDYLATDISDDLQGVQMAGAVKNVIALALGMLEGAGYTDNAQAFVCTRGLQEMAALIQACGGNQQTAYGLAGVGDLMLTAFGKHSRNTALGRKLGAGHTLESLMSESGTIPEGINTVVSIHQLGQKNNLQLPICTSLYKVIFEGASLQQLLTAAR